MSPLQHPSDTRSYNAPAQQPSLDLSNVSPLQRFDPECEVSSSPSGESVSPSGSGNTSEMSGSNNPGIPSSASLDDPEMLRARACKAFKAQPPSEKHSSSSSVMCRVSAAADVSHAVCSNNTAGSNMERANMYRKKSSSHRNKLGFNVHSGKWYVYII